MAEVGDPPEQKSGRFIDPDFFSRGQVYKDFAKAYLKYLSSTERGFKEMNFFKRNEYSLPIQYML